MEYVGVVIISHSSKLAEGLLELIRQVIKDVPVATAGGTEDGEIGTSMEKIHEAISSVMSEKGVIALYDLGSARMNAEMAVEFNQLENVTIANGIPLVEGSYVAAVESSIGKSREEIEEAIQKVKQMEI
ncbi:dihydroxyacetone kinase phosphoryl donor subunit DhaM [Saliterribacillus persicus]|uniref:phosphoenolpyruvate--glycerone phosphotransferase n=1 Tax=Saliterribacillus persicus TaxID=930114 RepID=A0A368Y3F0_9BACI|nr:dihydroxyacetone kinase phosphoryl donor subunit DhaM [Saliterribacillus persicus]RCW74801.1 dihydroxyacetone kinase DhaM subunit [Saliterribacillus persicus]